MIIIIKGWRRRLKSMHAVVVFVACREPGHSVAQGYSPGANTAPLELERRPAVNHSGRDDRWRAPSAGSLAMTAKCAASL